MVNEKSAVVLKQANDEKVKHPLRDTLVISFSFLFIYTSYLAIQNLQSSLNQEASLGITSLSSLYGTIIISGILAPSFIKIVGAKRTLVTAFVIHTLYVCCNFYPSWATLMPASIFMGGMAGPMWTSQGLYLTACGSSYSHNINENLHSALSKLNAIFFTCYETTQITGNLISSLVLKQSSYEADNSTKTCGADTCPSSGSNSTIIEEPEQNVVYILLGIFLVCDVIGVCLTLFFLPPLKKSHSGKDQLMSKTLVSCFTTLVDKKMILLIPIFMSNAMSAAILLSEYTRAYISCSLGVSMVGYVMACFGGSTAILTLLVGRLAKYTGRYFLFTLGSMVDLAMLVYMLLWTPTPDNVAAFFIIPTIWGISEAIFQAQFNSLVSVLFEEKIDSAFANYHTSKAVAYTCTFVFGVFLCISTILYIGIAVNLFGFIGYIVAEVIFHRNQLNKNRKETSKAKIDEKTHL